MPNVSRRRFLAGGIAAAASYPIPRSARGAPSPTTRPLAKFVQPLPLPGNGIVVATPRSASAYEFTLREIARSLHPDLPPTPLFAYDDGSGLAGQAGSFGMLVAARSGTPVSMTFTHALPEYYPEWVPVDTRLTAEPDRRLRIITHLHGGFVGAASDGNPALQAGGFVRGQSQSVTYPNALPQQPASLLWFHDHALGATRLNVAAGLAAGYLLRDAYDTGLDDNVNGLPAGRYEVPLVIQDRMLNDDGTLYYPASTIPGVVWIGEYFGDLMLVNGKVWPYLDVEPALYRLRVLNGCNARILALDLGGVPMWQIGAEGGLFDVPVRVDRLLLAPAERADVLVDFRPAAGRRLLLRNNRPPMPIVNPAPPLTQVMQFRVGATSSQPPRTVPTLLQGGRRATHAAPARTRYVTLNEVDVGEPEWMLNFDAQSFGEHVDPSPRVGDVEDWVYVNMTGDTHPIHTHLVSFEVVGRTPFDAVAFARDYGGPDGVPGGIDPSPYVTGATRPPTAVERGFKDTVQAHPGELTRIRARFELPPGVAAPQRYVHHCHIVEHEDNDMMQAYTVIP